eukprot:2635555-Prymnesium_polylepis.1
MHVHSKQVQHCHAHACTAATTRARAACPPGLLEWPRSGRKIFSPTLARASLQGADNPFVSASVERGSPDS